MATAAQGHLVLQVHSSHSGVHLVTSLLSRLRAIVGRFIDDSLPMTIEDRDERDWTGETSAEEAERRELRFQMEMLEKRGKGGVR